MEGWIKIHRQIQKHWIWDNPEYLKAWIAILLSVNHDGKKVLIHGELFDCGRGESLISLSNWAKTFVDIYGFVNDTTLKSVMLPNDEKLGKISLNMTDVDGNYIVELTTLSRDRVLKTINVSKDGIIEFPYIAPGKYSVRITSDANRNGFLDTGNLSEKRQPEKVRLYRMSNGSSVIIIEESMEIVQEVNIKNIFAD